MTSARGKSSFFIRSGTPPEASAEPLVAGGKAKLFGGEIPVQRAYECRRENDGSFLLHLTLHQPSQQPLDTLYTLRLDPGRQTVVTLIFIREAFGYKEPLFPPAMLDEFMLQKLDAHRTK